MGRGGGSSPCRDSVYRGLVALPLAAGEAQQQTERRGGMMENGAAAPRVSGGRSKCPNFMMLTWHPFLLLDSLWCTCRFTH